MNASLNLSYKHNELLATPQPISWKASSTPAEHEPLIVIECTVELASIENAPAGSYTKRLLDDPDLLRDKLVEVVQEWSEATEP